MPKKKTNGVKKQVETIRLCANIRSRKHPDVRCPCHATHGEFCTRHYKNPTRFQEKNVIENSPIPTHNQTIVVSKLQRWWKQSIGYIRFFKQGPATNVPSVAENETDIYSLDPTASIPLLYRWSYADSKKHIWLFDIRSLSMTRVQNTYETLLNPYTREKIPDQSERNFQERCAWLREKKYCLVHSTNTELTPDQLWHQKILDVTMKYDMLGYHTCLHWFEELNLRQLAGFYTELWELWFIRLQLNHAVKHQVVPNWNRNDSQLFRWSPLELLTRSDKRWWQRVVLELMERLVSSAELKEHRVLGALYGMTAFAIVSQRVRQYYPWLVEIEEDT